MSLETDAIAYMVEDDPPLVMYVGEQHDGLRLLLASFGVDEAVIVTAWNPGGLKASYDDNIDYQAALLEAIEAHRLNYFVGHSEHPQSGHIADNLLVLGLDREQGRELAAQFGQGEFVWLSIAGTPELVPVTVEGLDND